MSIAAPVLETTDPNSIATMPITLEEAVTAVIAQTDRAQSAADSATLTLEEAEQQAALAEASRIAAAQAQTAAAASASAAAASAVEAAAEGALSIAAINAAEAASIIDIEAARDAAIDSVEDVLDVPPPVRYVAVTASANLEAGEQYRLRATSGTITLTLPASPANGDTVRIVDGETVGAGPTYTLARNGQTIMGLAEDMTLDSAGLDLEIWFNGTTWRLF